MTTSAQGLWSGRGEIALVEKSAHPGVREHEAESASEALAARAHGAEAEAESNHLDNDAARADPVLGLGRLANHVQQQFRC